MQRSTPSRYEVCETSRLGICRKQVSKFAAESEIFAEVYSIFPVFSPLGYATITGVKLGNV